MRALEKYSPSKIIANDITMTINTLQTRAPISAGTNVPIDELTKRKQPKIASKTSASPISRDVFRTRSRRPFRACARARTTSITDARQSASARRIDNEPTAISAPQKPRSMRKSAPAAHSNAATNPIVLYDIFTPTFYRPAPAPLRDNRPLNALIFGRDFGCTVWLEHECSATNARSCLRRSDVQNRALTYPQR